MPPSRIPPLIHPYVDVPPKDTLILATSVIGATTNWLLLRYLCAAFESQDEGNGIVFISFMRDWSFWKNEARRAGGLDLNKLGQQRKLAYVDGLSNLFLPEEQEPIGSQVPPGVVKTSLSHRPVQTIAASQRASPIAAATVARGPPAQRTQAPVVSPQSPTPPTSEMASIPDCVHKLRSPDVAHLKSTVQNALQQVSAARKLLIIDDLSILVSATSTPPQTLISGIIQLRSMVHATVISLPADSPLVHLPSAPAPLEANHASLLVSLAHSARLVVGLRLLDTGAAKDVSGVVTITRGGYADEDIGDGNEPNAIEQVEEKELLYYIAGDGSVKVFERGAGTDVG